MKAPLEKLAVTGTAWQAKQAIRSLIKLFDTDVAVLPKVAKVSGVFFGAVAECLFGSLHLSFSIGLSFT
jgi:hypothetical protein